MSAMPVYEFNCSKCGERFEVMGNYAEREKEHACPKCGSTEVKQAISLFSAAPPRSYQSPRPALPQRGREISGCPPPEGERMRYATRREAERCSADWNAVAALLVGIR